MCCCFNVCFRRWAAGLVVRRPLHESDGLRISQAYLHQQEDSAPRQESSSC